MRDHPTDIQGIGFLTPKILALTGDIRRFPNLEHYASYAGTEPIDVSSDDQETHHETTGYLPVLCLAGPSAPGPSFVTESGQGEDLVR